MFVSARYSLSFIILSSIGGKKKFTGWAFAATVERLVFGCWLGDPIKRLVVGGRECEGRERKAFLKNVKRDTR